jgi:hypothetical protein
MTLAENATSIKCRILVSGPSTSQYEVIYPRGTQIMYIPANSEPPTPYILTAVFSSSGTTVIVSFSANTDLGLVTTSKFGCSKLFVFKNASSSNCQWQDSSNVIVYSNKVNIGDTIRVFPNTIKAQCTSAQLCDKWNYTTPAAVTIRGPAYAVVPSIVIAAPAIINKCDSLSVDLSSSTGSGGRPWSSYSFTVFDNKNSSDRSDVTGAVSYLVMMYLQTNYSISPPMSLPNGIFDVSSYTIIVKLTNFLGASSQGSVTIGVVSKAIPNIQLYGTRTRSILRRQSLMLSSDAFVTQCTPSGSIRTSSNLKYEWSIQKESSSVSESISSLARAPNMYKLASYSLQTRTVYTVTLSVLNTRDIISSTTSIQVYVSSSDIVAVISGGGDRSLLPGQTITVDASTSYDMDLNSFEVPQFKFSWSCYSVKPSISQDCGLKYLSTLTGYHDCWARRCSELDLSSDCRSKRWLKVINGCINDNDYQSWITCS